MFKKILGFILNWCLNLQILSVVTVSDVIVRKKSSTLKTTQIFLPVRFCNICVSLKPFSFYRKLSWKFLFIICIIHLLSLYEKKKKKLTK